MPVRITPAEFQEKHARNLKASLVDMRAGVERVTEAPGAKAAAKQDKMLANLTAKITDGTWAARLKAVSLESWREKMVNKGLPRVSGGIDAAKDKVTDFASQLLPAVDAASRKVAAMPDLTLEDSISRMTTMVREMAKFRKK
ncbi:hypothetical protein ES703_25088 [subsurface metagenome]